MGFIGGGLRERFVDRVKDADPGKLLAVPIDVGKRSAAAMVCDFWGEIVIPPFDFPLNEDGFQDFSVALTRAEAQRDATWMRVGLESAGHYHRPLQARLEANGIEVTLFNPAQIKENRNQDLLRSLKSDAIDLAAMAELLIRGKGRVCVNAPDAVAIQGALALHRTICNILRRNGLGPAPRHAGPTWTELLRTQADFILASDFFTAYSLWGKTLYVLFIEISTRRVHVAGCTARPDSAWVTQQARNLSMCLEDRSRPVRFLVHDRDAKYGGGFDGVFRSEGVDIIRT